MSMEPLGWIIVGVTVGLIVPGVCVFCALFARGFIAGWKYESLEKKP